MDQQQPQQPQWSPPPQQPTGWGGPGYMGPVARPLGVTLSAIWFYIIGILALFGAVLLLAGSTMLESVFGGGFFASLGIIFAFIVGLIAVLMLLTGWGIWGGKGWGRVAGIVLGVLGVLGGLSALTGNSIAYGVVTIAIWAGVIYALWMASAYFAARR